MQIPPNFTKQSLSNGKFPFQGSRKNGIFVGRGGTTKCMGFSPERRKPRNGVRDDEVQDARFFPFQGSRKNASFFGKRRNNGTDEIFATSGNSGVKFVTERRTRYVVCRKNDELVQKRRSSTGRLFSMPCLCTQT